MFLISNSSYFNGIGGRTEREGCEDASCSVRAAASAPRFPPKGGEPEYLAAKYIAYATYGLD
ncbi:hypothetical protein KDK_30180 [Dictyobacter kobayashii]|uniref:Uncharacterized protein n=1 Tax=Dictyobacter kobayashii TaxID=2014872 RepID=A0A402AJ72_9CHLR|nr:hypothetical protein KDK_30180 [Dictyobacter kobayashii]